MFPNYQFGCSATDVPSTEKQSAHPTKMKDLLKMGWRERYIVIECGGILIDFSTQKPTRSVGPNASGILSCTPIDRETNIVKSLIMGCRGEWAKASKVKEYAWLAGGGLETLILVGKNECQMGDCRKFLHKHYFGDKNYYGRREAQYIECVRHGGSIEERVCALKSIYFCGRFNSRNNHVLTKSYPNRKPPLVYLLQTDALTAAALADVVKGYEMEPVTILLPSLSMSKCN